MSGSPELPLIGNVLDRYRLSRLLADHGTTATYLADDLGLNRTVRLTAVALDAPEAPAVVTRRDRIAGFRHQHALAVYDAGASSGVCYVVHPHVQHPTLAEAVAARRRLDGDDVLALAQQIGHALDSAHAAGLEHGQLTAERVLLPRRSPGWYAVVDGIGLAALEALATRRDQLPPPLPERGNAAPDVAALGRLLFFALVGRAMAGAAHPDYAHLGAATGADRAAEARRDLPPAIDDVLAASQATVDPAYPDCAALVRAARDVLRGANRHTIIERG